MTARTARWAELYNQGMSLRAVADVVGVTHKAVLYAFREEGVPRRPRCQAHNSPPRVLPKPWPIDWCNECSETRKINPKTGWCSSCTSNLRTGSGTIRP